MDFTPPAPEPRWPANAIEPLPDDILEPEEYLLFDESLRAANATAKKPGAVSSGVWLLVSMVLFVLSNLDGFNPVGIGLLVAVLLFHEAGHYLGMKVFGYTDVKMFFIPFFGAAVTGKKHAAAAWQEIVVLLLGPLPGLFLGAALYFVLRPDDTKTAAFQAIIILVCLNAFNLLPFMPLDGGRIMNLLIFRRHPVLEVLFKLFAVVGLLIFAVLLMSWVLGLIAIVTAMGIPLGYSLAKRASWLRRDFPTIAAEWKDQGLAELRQMYKYAREAVPPDRNPALIGTRMTMLHELAAASSPGIFATFFFLVVYGASFLVAPVLVVAVANDADAQRAAAQQLPQPVPPREPAPVPPE